tara:strand:+ start:319 stop:1089 length:771 start_codon:yes stop_codon:yes gene_type:complete
LNFNVDSKTLLNALSDIQGRGKYSGHAGLSNNELGEYCYMKLENNVLELWNGDTTLALNINIPVESEKDGDIVVAIKPIMAYLKMIDGDVSIEGEVLFQISHGSQMIRIPRIVEHPSIAAITRIKGMIEDIALFELEDKNMELPLFGDSVFEAAFNLDSSLFHKMISFCEQVKTGVYKLDFNDGTLIISSGQGNNSYTETHLIDEAKWVGAGATVEWSGPLHKFFKGEEVSFYVKDEFPLVLVSTDRKLIRAPHVG